VSSETLGVSAAQTAKATLLRLAQGRLEPTPENYARAWIEAGGTPPQQREAGAEGAEWVQLLDDLVRGVEQSNRMWTVARRKESVRRVLANGRSHPQRLRERLTQLVASWQSDEAVDPALVGAPTATTAPAALDEAPVLRLWPDVADGFERSLRAALPAGDAQAESLARELEAQAARWRGGALGPALAEAVQDTCAQARQVFLQRNHLVDELGKLVRSLGDGLTELAEEESWARGQAEALRVNLDGEVLSVRGVRAAADMLTQTRRQQQRVRGERDRARAALKTLVESLSSELDALGGQTGRFSEELVRCTDDLGQVDSREQLGAVLHQMLTASRGVQSEVAEASARIAATRGQADQLNSRVAELEGELRRLSEEVSTDALTQVANRRGLQQAFDVESARSLREGRPLAVGLVDIDNFKKLNDTLGHAAGDEALKALAAQVRDTLRPLDHVARFGGEEFVVLLPGSDLTDAQEALTRVQRRLSMSLFMHEGRDVFVTFSAGVTLWRDHEALGVCLERADAALYEAKRAGKNRTCAA
jgi:diguanylate cyclase